MIDRCRLMLRDNNPKHRSKLFCRRKYAFWSGLTSTWLKWFGMISRHQASRVPSTSKNQTMEATRGKKRKFFLHFLRNIYTYLLLLLMLLLLFNFLDHSSCLHWSCTNISWSHEIFYPVRMMPMNFDIDYTEIYFCIQASHLADVLI